MKNDKRKNRTLIVWSDNRLIVWKLKCSANEAGDAITALQVELGVDPDSDLRWQHLEGKVSIEVRA